MSIKRIWNAYKDVLPCFCCMAVCGWNEFAMFSVFWAMQDYYELNYTKAALVYLTEGIGFFLAALLVQAITDRIGRLWTVVLGVTLQILVQVIIATTPPFAVIVAFYGVFGIGWALIFSHLNAYSATLPNCENKIFIVHAGYGLGSLLTSLSATSFLVHHRFSHYFAISAALTFGNLLILFWTFRTADRAKRNKADSQVSSICADKDQAPSDLSRKPKGLLDIPVLEDQEKEAQKILFTMPRVWLYAGLFFLMVGAEHVWFGWSVRYMLDAKGARPSIGYALTALMACHALARVILPRVTTLLGPKTALLLYQTLFLVLSALIWRVRNIVACGAFIAALGIAISPMVPSLLCDMFANVRSELHVQLAAFVVSFGMVAGGIGPFAVGGITNRLGITVVPVVAMVIMGVSLLLTLALTDRRSVTAASGVEQSATARAETTQEKIAV